MRLHRMKIHPACRVFAAGLAFGGVLLLAGAGLPLPEPAPPMIIRRRG